MPASTESDTSSTQSTQPRDPMSLVLQDACSSSHPVSAATTVWLGGDAISDESDLQTGPCTTSDGESGVQKGTYYDLDGWRYYEVPIKDYLRAGISRRIGRVVSKPEYSVYHALLRSSDPSVKDICQALDITAGAGRWDELRRRCQSYRTTLAGNRDVRNDLKETIEVNLLMQVCTTARLHLKQTIVKSNGHSEQDRQALLSNLKPGLVGALCGYQSPRGKYQVTEDQAELLFRVAEVNVRTCNLISIV